MWQLAVAEVFDPGGANNKHTGGLVKELLEVWARGMKDGMVMAPPNSGELLARKASGDRGGDTGGGCSAASREGGCD